MFEARTSDQRRKCIRRGRYVKVTAGNSLSEGDGACFSEFFLPFNNQSWGQDFGTIVACALFTI